MKPLWTDLGKWEKYVMELKDKVVIIDDQNISRLLNLYGNIIDTNELSKMVNGHLSVAIDEIEEDETVIDGQYKNKTIIESNIMEENNMTKELSIENIKKELMDALVGDMRIITAFGNKEKRRATDYIGSNILNYLDDTVENICYGDTYIHFDVMKSKDRYDVFIQLKAHKDISYRDNKHVNLLDEISKYIEEIVKELYPYHRLYADVPKGCIDRYLRRNIRFSIYEHDAKSYQQFLEDKTSK